MSLRKRPCGVSSAAQMARPGATFGGVVGDQALQEFDAVGPADRDHTAMGNQAEGGCGHDHDLGLGVRLAKRPDNADFYLCENERHHHSCLDGGKVSSFLGHMGEDK